MGSCAATYLIVLPLRRTTANMAKRIIDPIGVAARRAARAQIGRLRDSKIQRATFLRYFTAVYTFCHHLFLYNQTMAESFECLDSQLNIYIEWLWESGQSLNDAKDVLSGCSHFLNTRRRFPGAWRLVSIWSQMELPERAPALPPVVMQAMLGLRAHLSCKNSCIPCRHRKHREELSFCTIAPLVAHRGGCRPPWSRSKATTVAGPGTVVARGAPPYLAITVGSYLE